MPSGSGEMMPTELYVAPRAEQPVVMEATTGDTAEAESIEVASSSAEHIRDDSGIEWINPVYRNSSLMPPDFEHAGVVVVTDSAPRHQHAGHLHTHSMHSTPFNMSDPCLACLALKEGAAASGEVTRSDSGRKYEQLLLENGGVGDSSAQTTASALLTTTYALSAVVAPNVTPHLIRDATPGRTADDNQQATKVTTASATGAKSVAEAGAAANHVLVDGTKPPQTAGEGRRCSTMQDDAHTYSRIHTPHTHPHDRCCCSAVSLLLMR